MLGSGLVRGAFTVRMNIKILNWLRSLNYGLPVEVRLLVVSRKLGLAVIFYEHNRLSDTEYNNMRHTVTTVDTLQKHTSFERKTARFRVENKPTINPTGRNADH